MEKSALKNEFAKRPHLRMNYGGHINALGLAIGKDVHLILHCKNSKRIPDFRFYISMPPGQTPKQLAGTAEKGLDSRKRRVRQHTLNGRTNDVHMRFPVIWKGILK